MKGEDLENFALENVFRAPARRKILLNALKSRLFDRFGNVFVFHFACHCNFLIARKGAVRSFILCEIFVFYSNYFFQGEEDVSSTIDSVDLLSLVDLIVDAYVECSLDFIVESTIIKKKSWYFLIHPHPPVKVNRPLVDNSHVDSISRWKIESFSRIR